MLIYNLLFPTLQAEDVVRPDDRISRANVKRARVGLVASIKKRIEGLGPVSGRPGTGAKSGEDFGEDVWDDPDLGREQAAGNPCGDGGGGEGDCWDMPDDGTTQGGKGKNKKESYANNDQDVTRHARRDILFEKWMLVERAGALLVNSEEREVYDYGILKGTWDVVCGKVVYGWVSR